MKHLSAYLSITYTGAGARVKVHMRAHTINTHDKVQVQCQNKGMFRHGTGRLSVTGKT